MIQISRATQSDVGRGPGGRAAQSNIYGVGVAAGEPGERRGGGEGVHPGGCAAGPKIPSSGTCHAFTCHLAASQLSFYKSEGGCLVHRTACPWQTHPGWHYPPQSSRPGSLLLPTLSTSRLALKKRRRGLSARFWVMGGWLAFGWPAANHTTSSHLIGWIAARSSRLFFQPTGKHIVLWLDNNSKVDEVTRGNRVRVKIVGRTFEPVKVVTLDSRGYKAKPKEPPN